MKKTLLVMGVIASLTLVHSTFADDSNPEKTSDESSNGSSEHHEHHEHHEHINRWAVSISPHYYSLNSSGYSSAFTGAGVPGPSSGTVGLDFSVFWALESNWQIGIGFGGVDTTNSNGSSSAEYSDNFFGLWLARDFQLCNDFDVAVGGLFGFGSASTQIFTTGISGQTTESSFTLEPKIIVAYKIAPWLKIGVSGSYIEPMAQSQSIQGNTLTTGHISLHGVSGGVEFVVGRFGQRSESPGF